MRTLTVIAIGVVALGLISLSSCSSDSGSKNPPPTGASTGQVKAELASDSTAQADSQAPPVDVLTYHNDNARTGQNLNETILTTDNVDAETFGKIGIMPVPSNVDAEPLYVSGLTVNGVTHNVVFVASESDVVYAFDADTFAPLWHASVTSGESPSDEVNNCFQVQPSMGVTATPVIDLDAGPHGTIFVVAMTKDSAGNYHQRLHALDLTSGVEQPGSPALITATSGQSKFDPMQYKERAGLLLVNGYIYLAWASHCDIDPYQGWLMAYRESNLQQTSVLNVTPTGTRGGIWMANTAMAADPSGNIYVLVGNGTFGDGSASPVLNSSGFPAQPNFGNAFLKLSTANNSLFVQDYFAMFNANAESDKDLDLGSGGAIVLPELADSQGAIHRLAVGAGKDGYIYVVDRDAMGKYNPSNDQAIYQKLNDPQGDASGTPALTGQVLSMPAYFNGTVYFNAEQDTIKAFPVSDGMLATQPSSQTPLAIEFPGCTPSVSANRAANGIVWCVGVGAKKATLYAFDAADLSQELYDSGQAGKRDAFVDNGSDKFATPMIANGKVYVGTTRGVVVFGLLHGSAKVVRPRNRPAASDIASSIRPKSATSKDQNSERSSISVDDIPQSNQ
ncbi:MAG TPA: pyrrolo-quinoline quinone [Candidatus Binatia bacterium]|nr:pyrrolo-quinoline quinone [Candidatus Binatia bacterium]